MASNSYTKRRENLIAEFTDWAGVPVEVHGLKDGFAVFVEDRLVQKGMNGSDMARYFCHVLQANHALIKSIKPSSLPESLPAWQSIETAPIKPFNAQHWYMSHSDNLLLSNGYGCAIGAYGYTQRGKGRWQVDGRTWGPTHWMPLPESPSPATRLPAPAHNDAKEK